MKEIILGYRNRIISEMESFFGRVRENFKMRDKWFFDVLDRLYEFSISGKMIRGALVMFSENMFSNKITNDSVKCAICIELLQSGLLIHDDIMDEDTQRRGKDSVFFQYKKLADSMGIENSYHIGESVGICAGNFAFSLAFLSLAEIEKKKVLDKLILKFGEEMAIVGVGQMKDVITSGQRELPTEDDIVSIYRYKTARYSFSLPFSLGAILSEVSEDDISLIEEIGECIGIIFQIQDDKIGIVGNENVIGKPVGSDIKENKKTLYYLYLMNSVNDEEKSKLLSIFGNRDIGVSEVDYVIHLLNKYDIFKKVETKVMEFVSKAKNKISRLSVDDKYKQFLLEFIQYNLNRDK